MITVCFEKLYEESYICEVEAETLEEAIEIAKEKKFEYLEGYLTNVSYMIEDNEEGQKYRESTNIEENDDLPLDGWR